MTQIIPTITAENAHIYREQMARLEPFAERIHVDLMDGVFAPSTSLPVEQVWFPEGKTIDFHVMFQQPEAAVRHLLTLKPDTIILPAEADFEFATMRSLLQKEGIKLGLALLPDTTIDSLGDSITQLDHLLIFSGNLGYQGGSTAKLDLLEKAQQATAKNPHLEIGWDGGVNNQNVRALAEGGITAINVGGFIHSAPDAGLAYQQLVGLLP